MISQVRFFLCIILIIQFGLVKSVKSQSVAEIQADRQTYICGMGTGPTERAADQEALAIIIEQIYLQVESNFEMSKIETTGEKFKETVKDVVRTYSSATLKNAERILVKEEPDAKVFRYIKRSEITKIFESRKNKLIELAKNGVVALDNLQIADALRYFYWSQTLLRSHPESSDIRMMDKSGKDVLLITWLPMQINQIMANLSIGVDTIHDEDDFCNYLLDIRYKNVPLLNLDYTYWSGQDWSNIVSAKNGVGIVELPKIDNRGEIRLKCEYAFEGEANIDLELRTVMEKLPQIPYKSCYFNISAKPRPKVTVPVAAPVNAISTEKSTVRDTNAVKVAQAPAKVEIEPKPEHTGAVHEVTNSMAQDAVMKSVVAAITRKDFTTVKPLFTDEGYSVFQKLLQYGNAKIIKSFDLKYYQYDDYVICRSIPMSFSFKTNNRTFIEDVVFYFDKQNKLCNISFGLSRKAIEDIASNESWSESNRVLLISFLENYKTAFALKRYDYIDQIFSDDALIITGLVTKVARTSDSQFANNTIIKYNRQSKTEYLKKLKYSFDSKEYINIRFADNNVRRSGKGVDVYGIQIKQDYFSTNYGDSGYLFLLVDLSDTLKPQIHVRTWQPEKNPDGSIYGLSDF
ncbi:MAG: LPP20 family lipoprotein [Prolixibacteraceae bacterium]